MICAEHGEFAENARKPHGCPECNRRDETPVPTSAELNELFIREGLSENYLREQARFSNEYRKAQAAS